MNQNFLNIGSASATITSISEPVNGINPTTGQPWTYVTIEAVIPGATKPYRENMFTDKDYNKLADIVVGASIDIKTTVNTITGEITRKSFIASKFLSNAELVKLTGGTIEQQQAASSQAKANAQKSAAQRIADRAAARAAALNTNLPS